MPSAAKRPRRQELLDRADLPVEEAARALRDLRRVNRVLLSGWTLCRVLVPALDRGPRQPWIADLGTGAGDVSGRLAARARRTGYEPTIVGVDRKLAHLLLGRRYDPRQRRVVADVEALPFDDGGLDWTVSNLLLHHFDRETGRRVLTEASRVARRGAVTVDLRRSRLASLLARLVLPLLRVGRVASYDGRISIDQAWDVAEVAEVATGLGVRELRRRFPFRFSLKLSAGQPVSTDPSPPAAVRTRPPSPPR